MTEGGGGKKAFLKRLAFSLSVIAVTLSDGEHWGQGLVY